MEDFSLYGDLTHERFSTLDTDEDKKFVSDCVSILDSLKEDINIMSPKQFLKESSTKTKVDELGKLFSKRLGFTVIMKFSPGGASTFTSPVPGFDPYNGDTTDWVGRLKDLLKNESEDGQKDLIYGVREGLIARMKSMEVLRKHIENNPITIDFKRGMVKGLPKEFEANILFDPFSLLHKSSKSSSEEALAVLLHEAGHNVTSFYVSCKKTVNLHILLDTVNENVFKRNKGKVETLTLAYERITGSKTNDKNIFSLISKFSSLVSENGILKNERLLSNPESERHADIFTSRFLLGDELAAFLSRHPMAYQYRPMFQSEESFIVLLVILAITVFVGPLLLIVTTMVIMTYVNGVTNVRDYLFNDKTYDKTSRRLLHLKRDAIAQLRVLGKEEETKSVKYTKDKLVSVIKNIEASIEIIKDKEAQDKVTSFFDKHALGKEGERLYSSQNDIENMINNDLYYIANR